MSSIAITSLAWSVIAQYVLPRGKPLADLDPHAVRLMDALDDVVVAGDPG